MQACAELRRIRTLLANHLESTPHGPAPEILARLAQVEAKLHQLEHPLRDIAEVDDALALGLELMNAAYDKPLNADRLRCLLQPLREKLGDAVERMRGVIV